MFVLASYSLAVCISPQSPHLIPQLKALDRFSFVLLPFLSKGTEWRFSAFISASASFCSEEARLKVAKLIPPPLPDR